MLQATKEDEVWFSASSMCDVLRSTTVSLCTDLGSLRCGATGHFDLHVAKKMSLAIFFRVIKYSAKTSESRENSSLTEIDILDIFHFLYHRCCQEQQ